MLQETPFKFNFTAGTDVGGTEVVRNNTLRTQHSKNLNSFSGTSREVTWKKAFLKIEIL